MGNRGDAQERAVQCALGRISFHSRNSNSVNSAAFKMTVMRDVMSL